MGSLLFNPNGRIAKNRFWQGMVILTVASALVSAASWLVNTNLGLLNWVLIFPYVCVYGKRFHDAGQTAWWSLAVFIAALVLYVILLMIFMFTLMPSFMSAEQREIWDRVWELSEKGDTSEAMKGLELLMESMEGLFQRAYLFIIVITNAILAFIVGLLKTEPRENKHGPVPGTLENMSE